MRLGGRPRHRRRLLPHRLPRRILRCPYLRRNRLGPIRRAGTDAEQTERTRGNGGAPPDTIRSRHPRGCPCVFPGASHQRAANPPAAARLGLGDMKILTSEQMQSIDRRATEEFGIPSIVLMENAAIGVMDAI